MMGVALLIRCLVLGARGQWVHHKKPALPISNGYSAIGYYDQYIYLMYVLLVFVLDRIYMRFYCL